MTRTRVLLALAVAIGLLVGPGLAAHASTAGCTGGALAGYCGTQARNQSPRLVIDSQGQRRWPTSPSTTLAS